MEITQEQIEELDLFVKKLNELEEYLFWNLSVFTAQEHGHFAITYEDKWEALQKWKKYDGYT